MRKTNKTLYRLISFIFAYSQKYGYYPTIREMATHLDVNSTCTVFYYMGLLEKKGIIGKTNQKSRAINLLKTLNECAVILDMKDNLVSVSENHLDEDSSQYKNVSTLSTQTISEKTIDYSRCIDVPLVGEITAGQPILAVENFDENYRLPLSLFKKENIYMLNVHGDSMIEAGILDGDKIVVYPQSSANNGDIIVALINDSATVKRYYKEKDIIRLQPANINMKPIYSKEVIVLGKVVGLVRNIK
ncbi:MAG: transcriptional repressor LexA [Candidatus Cloacimonetes bacterium]|nr:transcriptional repressor LexA [Candidatus Cloacimonadota bacterium]